MAGPYDYSINIPQPPAQNFLQSLLGIQQLKQMQQQGELAQQQAAIQQQNAAFQQEMQPLERQRVEAGIAAQRASAAHSGAATNLLGVQTTAAKLGLADKQLISSTLQNYFNDETKTVKDLAPILPLLDATAVENLGKAEQIRVNNEVSARLNEGKEITASDIRGWSNRQTLLRGPEQQQFQQSFLAMTPQFQSAAKSGMINAVNAAFAGNMEVARSSAAEVQQALLNSKDTSPAAKAVSDSFGKIVDLIDQNPNIPKEILALNVVNAAGLVGDPKLAEDALKVVKEFGDQTKPGGAGKGKEVDMDMEDLKRQEKKLQIQELQQKLDQVKPEKPLPSSLLRANAEINKSVDSANEMADKLEQASEAIRGLPSRGFLSEKYLQLNQIFRGRENPEITIRNNAAQLAGLGMLGAEKTAMGGAIRSNVQFQYATSKLPDAYQSPQALADKLAAQAQVQRKISKLMAIDAEWNSAFRGSQKAKTDEDILGYNVPAGTSRTQFKEMVAKELFPSQANQSRSTAPTSNLGRPVSTGTLPIAPAGGVFTIDGVEMKVVPRNK
jgi:hypothetical protein